jgi:uncharacterized protein (DUF697 family)
MPTDPSLGNRLYDWIEQSTETVGAIVTPIADNPIVKAATQIPGLKWLMAAVGQIDMATVQRDVTNLRQKHPNDSAEQLAQRVIADTALKAAGIGLATNFLPPLALMLFAVDLGAIAALQASMIYRIAAIYGFPPTEAARRGEMMAIWGLATGGSGLLKTGMSFVELLPIVGAVVGTVGDATLLYGLGYLACRFYETKQQVQT